MFGKLALLVMKWHLEYLKEWMGKEWRCRPCFPPQQVAVQRHTIVHIKYYLWICATPRLCLYQGQLWCVRTSNVGVAGNPSKWFTTLGQHLGRMRQGLQSRPLSLQEGTNHSSVQLLQLATHHSRQPEMWKALCGCLAQRLSFLKLNVFIGKH